MKIRLSFPLAIIVTAALVLATAFFLLSPRVAYTLQATSAYEAAQGRWQAAHPSSYTIVAVSNSLTQSTGGANTIRVDDGDIAEAHNPDCPDCPIEVFADFTVEGLFRRIEAECLHGFPTEFCNVAYHEDLGYPLRIDTYPYNRANQERPSITVTELRIGPGD